jgi:hypothetical protein
MISNIRFLLEIYKEHKKKIFRLKIFFFIIVNIVLFTYLFFELNNPLLFNKINIQSNLLEKGASIISPYINYIGLNIVQCKLLIMLLFIVILNIIIIYFSTILFVAFLIYLAKLWYKIQTNILINHENMKILDINFQYILSEKEKKDILDSYILNNNIKIDIETYNAIFNSILNLKEKKEIYIEIKNQITDYLTKIHLESQVHTFSDSILDFTQYLSKLDTWGIIKGVVIVGVLVGGVYFGYSLYINSLSKSKEMSEAILEANKKTSEIYANTLDKTNEQILKLNNDQIALNDHSLKLEEEMNKFINSSSDLQNNYIEKLNTINDQIDGIKNGVIQTAKWNQELNGFLNILGKEVNNLSIKNSESILAIDEIKKEMQDIFISDSTTASTIVELKRHIIQNEKKLEILVRVTNYFYSYLKGSKVGNVPPTTINQQNRFEENDDVD